MTKLDEYFRIREAAEYVGVAPNTLRNWGKRGKVSEIRHPINGYRLYAKDDLDLLLNQVQKAKENKIATKRPR